MIPTFDRLIQLLKECFDRENAIREQKRALRDLLAQVKNIDELRKTPMEMLKKLEDLEAQQIKALEEALAVATELAAQQPTPSPSDNEPPPVKAGDVAGQFRTLMDSIQNDARQPRDNEVATTLKSLDIELKGLIVVQNNEAHIAPPPPGSKVDPGLLSTIRMSFGTIPVLRATQEVPPASAPTPAPAPAPTPSPGPGPAGPRGRKPRSPK